jgi:hypothetical protein
MEDQEQLSEYEAWMFELGNLSSAVVINVVTDERLNFALREDEDRYPRWYRRIDSENYIPTEIRGEQFASREECADDDDFVERFEEECDVAESELFLAISLLPRYIIVADWCSPDDLRKRQKMTDYANQETVDATLIQLFGTTELF